MIYWFQVLFVVSAAICAVDSMFILDDGREYEYLNQMRLGKSSIYLVWSPSIHPFYLNWRHIYIWQYWITQLAIWYLQQIQLIAMKYDTKIFVYKAPTAVLIYAIIDIRMINFEWHQVDVRHVNIYLINKNKKFLANHKVWTKISRFIIRKCVATERDSDT